MTRRSGSYAQPNREALLAAEGATTMEFFRKLLGSAPKSANDYTERAKTYLAQGDYNRAIADCTRAIHLDMQSVEAYLDRGIAHDLLGRPDNAIADFTQAIRLDPNDPIAFSNRGNTYYSTDNYAQAVADYSEAIRLDPANPVRYEKRALAYRAAGNPVKAADDERKAEELAGTGYESQDPLHYFHRAEAYLGQDEFDKCITDLTEAIRLQPAVAGPVYALRGQAYSRKGDWERAIADYTQAIELNPTKAAYHLNRGLACAEKRDYDRAIADYSRAIVLDPKDGHAWFLRGLAWGFKGNHDQEIADLDEALRLDPNRADVHLARGVAWDDKGDCTKALADFTEAIRLDPKSAPAYQMRAREYRALGDEANADRDERTSRSLWQAPEVIKAETPEGPSFRIERHGDIAVIIPPQDLVQMQENPFQHAVQSVLAPLAADPPTRLIVDLTHVDNFDEPFMSFLLALRSAGQGPRQQDGAGGRVRAGPGANARARISATRLHRIAVGALQNGGRGPRIARRRIDVRAGMLAVPADQSTEDWFLRCECKLLCARCWDLAKHRQHESPRP